MLFRSEEQLACCYCQEGSLFEEKEKKKIPRGNRRKTPIIEQNDQIVVQNLDGIAIEIVNLVFVEIVKIGLNVMVAIQ